MKTLILIDGPNIFRQVDELRMRINYPNLMRRYDKPFVNFYTALYSDADGLDKMRPFADWAAYNGIRVISKQAVVHNGPNGEVLKGNLDVELTVDAICAIDWVDNYVLMSGDGDFAYLCNYLRSRGKHVTLIGATNASPEHSLAQMRRSFVADSLIRSCTDFINLNDRTSIAQSFIEKTKPPTEV